MSSRSITAVAISIAFVLGCSSGDTASSSTTSTGSQGSSSSTGAGGSASGDFVAGGDRPVTVHLPPGYDGKTPAPLLILLHGYSVTSALQDAYMHLGTATDAHGMIYAHPDGTTDAKGEPFWNATDACCDFYGAKVDDSAYLAGLVEEIAQKAAVDRKRVYFVGHSNGGFMSYRMACDHADVIAAIVSLAGATYADPSQCKPSEPVAVLEIHGTGDMTVSYDGGSFLVPYPSAPTTVSTWASYDGCAPTADTSGAPHDVDGAIQGSSGPAEATVTTYAQGCKPGGYAELWTIPQGTHIPSLSPTFAEQVVTFLLAHPKP